MTSTFHELVQKHGKGFQTSIFSHIYMIEVESNQSFKIINYLVRLIGLRNLFQNLTSFPTLECLIRLILILLTSYN